MPAQPMETGSQVSQVGNQNFTQILETPITYLQDQQEPFRTLADADLTPTQRQALQRAMSLGSQATQALQAAKTYGHGQNWTGIPLSELPQKITGGRTNTG